MGKFICRTIGQNIVKFISVFFTALLFINIGAPVFAITTSDLQSIINGTPYYEPCSGSSTAPSGISINNSAAQTVAQQASSGGVNVGYALYDSTGKLLANYNDTFENYGGSITKSMLLVAYLNQVGSGTISSQANGELTNMIENSDNSSANWVWGQLNNAASAVNGIASAAGMSSFQLDDSSDPVYILGQSKITASDFAQFFSKIDVLLPAPQKDFGLNLLSHLSSADQVGLLQAGLPGTVYSKEGWKPESSGLEGAPYIVNQAAQFSSSGTTYGVSVTVGGTTDQQSGETIIKNVVSALIKSGGSSNTSGSDPSSCCDNGTNGVPGDVGSGNTVWNSGLQPPYIVEEFAINVLEDLAQKKGLPTTDTVTSQHVLALVTWAILEGGDIMNTDLFNLYNTSQSGSDLGGVMQSTGNMAYPTFDQGVEATARTIDDGSHNGMLSALLSSSSTAQDFAHAESYSGTDPGTAEWAGAAKADPSGYEQKWDTAIQETQSSYSDKASIIIGTSAFEEQTNAHDQSKLSNINGGASSSACTSTSMGNIAQEALKLAWPEPFENKPASETGRSSATTNTPAYQAVLTQLWQGSSPPYGGADCGTFVSAVLRGSGADPNYPLSFTGAQWTYVLQHPELYDVQQNVTDMNSLQPGDILIVGGPNGGGAAGHTWIYVGKQAGGYYSASASGGDRSGNLTNDDLQPRTGTGYLRARLKTNANTPN